jgi:hypothetical protein
MIPPAAFALASAEEQARRLAFCRPCSFNRNGKCSECGCGGQSIEDMVRLAVRRCRQGKW